MVVSSSHLMHDICSFGMMSAVVAGRSTSLLSGGPGAPLSVANFCLFTCMWCLCPCSLTLCTGPREQVTWSSVSHVLLTGDILGAVLDLISKGSKLAQFGEARVRKPRTSPCTRHADCSLSDTPLGASRLMQLPGNVHLPAGHKT